MESKELRAVNERIEENFSDEDLEILASLFKALAHPIRLKILFLLYRAKDKKVCVSNLVELLGTSQPNVSQHLFVLRSAGLVSCRREKNFVCYSLNPGLGEKIIELLLGERCSFEQNPQGD